jgi:peptide/nickel transport system substrate-binding protein
LAEAGYPEGFEIGCSCPNDHHVNSEQICQALSSMWARIGIKVNLTSQPGSLHIKRLLSGKADIYLLGWANTPQLDAFSILNNVFRKSGRYNPGGYFNPKLENVVAQLEKEMDPEKRQKLMTEALLIQKHDFAIIPLHRDPLIWGKRKDLDVILSPDYKFRIWWSRFK